MRGIAALVAVAFAIISTACSSPADDTAAPPSTSDASTTEPPPATAAPHAPTTTEDASLEHLRPNRRTLVLARPSWTTGYVGAYVHELILERAGYDVTDAAENELDPAVAYRAMADGEIDLWASTWSPGHDEFFDEQMEDGSRVGDHLTVVDGWLAGQAREGLVIDRATAEAFDIESLEQINDDPALRELFDADGDGRAEVFGCQEAWDCDEMIDRLLADNDLDFVEQIVEAYDAMIAVAVERITVTGEPVVFFTWMPSDHAGEIDLAGDALWLPVSGEGKDSWRQSEIRVAARTDLLADDPFLADLLTRIRPPIGDVNALMAEFNRADWAEIGLRGLAEDWLDRNLELVDGWIAETELALGLS